MKTKKISTVFFAAIASIQSALATSTGGNTSTFKGFNVMADSANAQISGAGNTVVNLASILIGIISVVMLIWNFIKRSKNDGQSNDALANWGFGLLFAALGLQVAKFMFFQQ